MNFKDFVKERIAYYVNHFKKRLVLLDFNGDTLREINLSFDFLSDRYLQYMEENSNQETHHQQQSFKIGQISQNLIKISDPDLKQFWEHLHQSYNLIFNIEGQNIGDETILRMSELYQKGICSFKKLKFQGNSRISQISIGKLGVSLQKSANQVAHISLHGLTIGADGINRVIELIPVTGLVYADFGLIGNESLKYLAHVLEGKHKLDYLSFGQNSKDPWKQEGKRAFQNAIRRNDYCKQIHAINLYPENIINHYSMITQLNILCKKNRNLKIDERQNEFKAASLNPQHNKYYDPDNHSLNAYKFSVKSYLNNVFGSLLDEALYFLEKQRRNSLREEAIFTITKEPINKIILQDICTADGSIIVLTKYLLGKIKEKESQH